MSPATCEFMLRSLWIAVALGAAQSSCVHGDTLDDSELHGSELSSPELASVDDEASPTARATEEPGYRLTPRTVDWEACLSGPFRTEWMLPESRDDGGTDLLARMRELVGATAHWRTEDGIDERRLGDLVLAVRDLDDEARVIWLEETLPRHAPAFAERWGADLEQLLRDAYLFGSGWKPARNSDADGILFGPAWELTEGGERAWPAAHDPRVEQAATLFLADMVAIKEAESDYRAYPNNVGADYEAIYPVVDSFVEGRDERDNAFNAHTLYFRCDLPFPFSDYECNLHVLARSNARGEVVTDIYGPGSDFHYMGGRDTFLPVTTADGAWIGYLDVRWFGFDLDGVPDGAGDRKEAMRGSLGNLRRNAQRRFSEAGGERRCETGVVPSVPIRGQRDD